MKDYIFKYLDKRYPIEDGVIHLIDKRPHQRIEDLFGVGCGWGVIHEWAQSRIGKEYCFTYPGGTKEWIKNGDLHREDGPAKIYVDGGEYWYKNGERHREDGPAVIYHTGHEEWFKNGQYHREDGPAIIYTNGRKEWYQNGKRHRLGGPAVIHVNDKKMWYENGVFIKEL